ncbi:MAG: pyruvate synthase subunit beta [Dehalococcoidia bacterium]|nr:pyruvate synthase subunit beta [Dehalococcoidia bacterium]
MAPETVKVGKYNIDATEYLAEGHTFCTGCGEALAIRLVCKALGENTIISMATGCDEVCTSPLPVTSWRLPWMHTLFENASAGISGMEAGLKAMMRKGKVPERDIKFVAMGGDGGTSDIGLQSLSGALERGHDFLYVCWDNEAYMNTGIQRSSATPYGAATTTAPAGKLSMGQNTQKKNMVEICAAHDIPYVATACPSYPFDLMNKIKKGSEVKGPAYVHVLTPCPTGWRTPSNFTIEIGKLAVETGIFPLYEIENGRYRLNVTPTKLKPVEQYLKAQGRFRHLSPGELEKIQKDVDEGYAKLKEKVACFPAT